MTNTNRMSSSQEKFLRKVRDGSDTLAIIKAQNDLNEKRFKRWLRNRFFWGNLMRVLRINERARYTVIALAAKPAADMLEDAVNKKETLPVGLVLSLKVLNELALAQETVKRPRRGSAMKKRPKLDPERDLCHPATKHLEKELMI